MSKRVGRRTVALTGKPGVAAWASVAGQKENDGPYGGKFDFVLPDELNGEKSFEAAERIHGQVLTGQYTINMYFDGKFVNSVNFRVGQ